MITNTTSAQGSASAVSSLTGRTAGSSLGRDEFLKLLVTQLRNQDPMNPQQPHEFAAQLAQYSSVEQLTQLNDAMAAQNASMQLNAMIGKTALGASLLGKTVLAFGNQVEITAGAKTSIRAEIGTQGGTATLRLYDRAGNEVTHRDLGLVKGGMQTLALPSDLPAGDYSYKLEVKASDNSDVAVTPFTTGVVTGLSFENGQILLKLGGVSVGLDALSEVLPTTTTASN